MLYGALILTAAAGGLFWLASRRPRPRRWLLPRRALPRAVTAAVDRQHQHLYAGGLLGEAACAEVRSHFGRLLAAGRPDLVARELRAGLGFAVRVRALVELGTAEAGRVLEQALVRAHTGDPVEQAWYWVDLAAGLRRLDRAEALPAVLRCAEAAAGTPQGALLAAEAVAFPNFRAAALHTSPAVCQPALGALVAAARAARAGTADRPTLVRAGLGAILADACDRIKLSADPALTAAAIEAERVSRRLAHWLPFLPPDARAAAAGQSEALAATAARRREWLRGASGRLLARFPHAPDAERGAALGCLFELRADVAVLFPRPPDERAAWWADAVRALRWSRSSVVGPALAGLADRLARKPTGRAAVVLAALRGHPCHEAERALVRAAANPAVRAAAVGALGWWSPFDPDRVVPALRAARTDPDPGVRRGAVGALARLGERAALAEVAAGLTSEETAIRQDTAARIASDELTWLWPDLETAAASADPDAAVAASEALEQLRERLFGLAP